MVDFAGLIDSRTAAVPALYVTRELDKVKAERGVPNVSRADNDPEFASRAMQAWATRNGVELRFN